MMKLKTMQGAFLSILLVLAGCGKIPYRPKSIKSISIESDYTGIKDDVILRVKKLTEAEISHLFGHQGEKFSNPRFPLVPLHFSIHNLNDTALILDPKNISLESVNYRTVSKQLQSSSLGKTMRTMSYGALTAILTAGASFVGVIYGQLSNKDSYAENSKLFWNITAPLILIATPFIAFVKTIKSARTNGKIKQDIKKKTLHKSIVIQPGQQYDTLVFVHTYDYRSQFILKLVEENKNKTGKSIIFNVAMGKNNFAFNNKQ